MKRYDSYTIKSFKYNGKLHRVWQENWLVPDMCLTANHREAGLRVLINDQTRIIEASGKQWTSKTPGISFFAPGKWYNIVALLDISGIRYYCNIASPYYLVHNTLTYIDYDLDVVVTKNQGKLQTVVLDQHEYEHHRKKFRYPASVTTQTEEALQEVIELAQQGASPFEDEQVLTYYEQWKQYHQ